MHATRRLVLGMLGAGLAAPALRAQGIAGGRPTAIVLPYAPSPGQEVVSRIVIDAFTERFGGTYVNEHRPGAGTTVAARYTARPRPASPRLPGCRRRSLPSWRRRRWLPTARRPSRRSWPSTG